MSTTALGFGAPALHIVKQCSCGLNHTRESWSRLTLIGVQDLGEGMRASIRNCTCGSSLMRELTGRPTIKMSAVEFETIIAVEAAMGGRK